MSKEKQLKKQKRDDIFPFERINYLIIGAGLVLLILGYIALSGNTVEGFVPLTLAPLLLIIGYCVVIPIGIMYRKKERKPEDQNVPRQPQQ